MREKIKIILAVMGVTSLIGPRVINLFGTPVPKKTIDFFVFVGFCLILISIILNIIKNKNNFSKSGFILRMTFAIAVFLFSVLNLVIIFV